MRLMTAAPKASGARLRWNRTAMAFTRKGFRREKARRCGGGGVEIAYKSVWDRVECRGDTAVVVDVVVYDSCGLVVATREKRGKKPCRSKQDREKKRASLRRILNSSTTVFSFKVDSLWIRCRREVKVDMYLRSKKNKEGRYRCLPF